MSIRSVCSLNVYFHRFYDKINSEGLDYMTKWPRRDSNSQSSDSKSDALSIRPRDHFFSYRMKNKRWFQLHIVFTLISFWLMCWLCKLSILIYIVCISYMLFIRSPLVSEIKLFDSYIIIVCVMNRSVISIFHTYI